MYPQSCGEILLDVTVPSHCTKGKGERKTWVFVGNLSQDVTQSELREIFMEFGTILQIYINYGFASVQMVSHANIKDAVKHLNGIEICGKKITVKLPFEGESMEINAFGTSIKVENLPSMVTNERLKEALSRFGPVEKSVVITDNKGRSTSRGIVDFKSVISAQNAVKQIEEGCFLMTAIPRPISVKIIEQENSIYGLSEEQIIKTTEYYRETKVGPRLAKTGSFEEECAQTWKIRYNLEQKQRENFEKTANKSREMFEEEMAKCWQIHQQEVHMVKQEVLSQSDEEEKIKQLQKQEFEARTRLWRARRNMEIQNSNGIDETPVEKQMEKSVVLKTTIKKEREEEEINNEEMKSEDDSTDKYLQEDDSQPKVLCVYSMKTPHHPAGNEEGGNEIEGGQVTNESAVKTEEITEPSSGEITVVTSTTQGDSPVNNEEMIEPTSSSNKLPLMSNRSTMADTCRRKSLRKRKSPTKDESYVEYFTDEENNEVITNETDYEDTEVEILEERRTYATRSRMEIQNTETIPNELVETPFKKVKYNEEDPITVSQLKSLKLFGLSEEQKVILKMRGRPTPKLALTQECSGNSMASYYSIF